MKTNNHNNTSIAKPVPIVWSSMGLEDDELNNNQIEMKDAGGLGVTKQADQMFGKSPLSLFE